MRFKTRLIVAAAVISAATPALAHRGWLLPSGTIFSGDNEWVTVDAAASNDLFFPDHRPMQLGGVKVWKPDGSESKIENGSTGERRSTFDVKLDQQGTWRIGTVQSGVSGTFKVNGEEWRLGGRRGPPPGAGAAGAAAQPRTVASVDEIPADATDINITERSGSNNIFVTLGAPSDKVYQPAGKGLEMVPVTHPAELVATEQSQLRFLVDGKPAANVEVEVVPGGKRYRDSEEKMDLKTDANGVLAVTWPTAGMYWISAELADDKPSIARATKRQMSYVATLEVMAP